jgi:hypothetical protein
MDNQYEFISSTLDAATLGGLVHRLNTENNIDPPLKMLHNKTHSIVHYLINKLKKLDVCERDVPYIQFYPLLNICDPNSNVQQNISDPDIIHMNYMVFMCPENCLTSKMCNSNTFSIGMFREYYEVTEKDVVAKRNLYKPACPDTWYKKGEHRMLDVPTEHWAVSTPTDDSWWGGKTKKRVNRRTCRNVGRQSRKKNWGML